MERVTLYGELFFIVHPVPSLMSSKMISEVIARGDRFVVKASTGELTVDSSKSKAIYDSEQEKVKKITHIEQKFDELSRESQSIYAQLVNLRDELRKLK
jgi:hypothetical protein